jgi:hypothetical protein
MEKTTIWTTKSGKFITHRKCEITFTIPAIHNKHREITCNCFLYEFTSNTITYDIINGKDFIHEIGFDTCFSTEEIIWDNDLIPMQSVEKSRRF